MPFHCRDPFHNLASLCLLRGLLTKSYALSYLYLVESAECRQSMETEFYMKQNSHSIAASRCLPPTNGICEYVERWKSK